MPERGSDRMLVYCMSMAQEFQARMNRLRVFVKHNLSSGTANEIILREFLASHASGDFNVEQGFLCDPTEQDKVSKQCDILVHNQSRYPIVYSDGPIKVVWPESAKMVIEVKTNFKKDDIKTGLKNIQSAKQVNRHLHGVIFAFRSPKLDTVIKNLQEFAKPISPKEGPTAILLLDKGVIIHTWGWARRKDFELLPETDPNTYAVMAGKDHNYAVVVAFLLLLFFEAIGQNVGVFHADMVNMLLEMFDLYMEKIHEDIFIGRQ